MLVTPIRFAPTPSVAALLLLAPLFCRADAADDLVSAALARDHIPGVSIAVVRDGKIEKLAGYGLANVEHNIPVKPTTIFQIQSVTKTFTSTAILLLAEDGKLKIDDLVSQHLDGTPESWKAIALRHLLSHTSGIKDFINEPTVSLRIDLKDESEVLKVAVTRPLNFTPGEKYAYSNTNYHLLAMIVRKLTGRAYGDFLKERIFEPLGMSDTRIVSLSAIIPDRAAGYAWSERSKALRNGQYVAESILSYGGGGIVSTTADLAKWAAALQAGKVLKAEHWKEAWMPTKLTDGKLSGYGLGWGVGQVNGHRMVSHSGAHITGFTSSVNHFPDDRLTVIVLYNANNEKTNPGNTARQIAGLYNDALKAAKPAKP
jgi:D-alanyl-D-alanine carboxypeptidase